jgi:hypothetical protein
MFMRHPPGTGQSHAPNLKASGVKPEMTLHNPVECGASNLEFAGMYGAT